MLMKINHIIAKIPELDQSKMPGVDIHLAKGVFNDLLKGGAGAITELVGMLKDVDDGSDYRVRYCLHNLAKVVATDERKADREMFVGVLREQIVGDIAESNKVFLVQCVQWIGGKQELPMLVDLLEHKNERLFDAALAAITVNGQGAVEYLKKAHSNTAGARKAAIENAIRQIKKWPADKA